MDKQDVELFKRQLIASELSANANTVFLSRRLALDRTNVKGGVVAALLATMMTIGACRAVDVHTSTASPTLRWWRRAIHDLAVALTRHDSGTVCTRHARQRCTLRTPRRAAEAVGIIPSMYSSSVPILG